MIENFEQIGACVRRHFSLEETSFVDTLNRAGSEAMVADLPVLSAKEVKRCPAMPGVGLKALLSRRAPRRDGNCPYQAERAGRCHDTHLAIRLDSHVARLATRLQ